MTAPARHDSLSALPSPGARAAAFAGILLAGLSGGLIGYSLVRIQCDGDCGLPLGLGIFVGAVAAAGGASIVAVLMLRAIGEWREIQARATGRPTLTADLLALHRLARDVAVAAGDQAAAGRRADLETVADPTGAGARAALGVDTKSSRTDVVTRHDKAAESLIVETLTTNRPDDAIVGEEGTNRPGTSGIAWHVDPIDGTTNFLYGLPAWSTSVAAVDGEGGLVGAVYVPATGELFAAARGLGATRNDRPIAATTETELALALVATGFGYDPIQRARQAARFARLAPVVRDVRRMGSAAIDLCYTAAGFLDAYYEENLNSWDMAAGELIAREAGCRSGDFTGGPPRSAQLLVAGPGVFDQLQVLLADAGASVAGR